MSLRPRPLCAPPPQPPPAQLFTFRSLVTHLANSRLRYSPTALGLKRLTDLPALSSFAFSLPISLTRDVPTRTIVPLVPGAPSSIPDGGRIFDTSYVVMSFAAIWRTIPAAGCSGRFSMGSEKKNQESRAILPSLSMYCPHPLLLAPCTHMLYTNTEAERPVGSLELVPTGAVLRWWR